MNYTELLAMKLNDEITLGNYNRVVRVAGGFNYSSDYQDSLGGWRVTSIYVPIRDVLFDMQVEK